jgi:uncharacterized repeat protein (TIGR02543 family)
LNGAKADVTGQYEIKKQDGDLNVTPRPLTLKSYSASKQYDGTPLTDPRVTESAGENEDGYLVGGPIEGETFSYVFDPIPEITEIGSVTNYFEYYENDSVKRSNYKINAIPGTLTIEAAATKKVTVMYQKNGGDADPVGGYFDSDDEANGGVIQGVFEIEYTYPDTKSFIITDKQPTPPAGSGKIFGGWETTANYGAPAEYWAGNTYTFTEDDVRDQNVNLYAVWIDPATAFTVSYHQGYENGNEIDGNDVRDLPATFEYTLTPTEIPGEYEAITLSTATPKRGEDGEYIFKGWALASNLAAEYCVPSAFGSFSFVGKQGYELKPGGEIVLYAVWEAATKNYYLNLYRNIPEGDKSIVANPSFNINGGLTPDNTPRIEQVYQLTEEGRTFTNMWNKAADGSGEEVPNVAAPLDLDLFDFVNTSSPYYKLDLYAQWELNPGYYTLEYDANGGDLNGIENYRLFTDDDLPLRAPTSKPTWAGHTFTGWNTASNGVGGKAVAHNGVIFGDGDTPYSIKLYAQWEEDARFFRVTYDPGDHGTFSRVSYEVKENDPTPAVPDNYRISDSNRYDFSGWSNTWRPTVTANVTYTAQWTYDPPGGGGDEPDPSDPPETSGPTSGSSSRPTEGSSATEGTSSEATEDTSSEATEETTDETDPTEPETDPEDETDPTEPEDDEEEDETDPTDGPGPGGVVTPTEGPSGDDPGPGPGGEETTPVEQASDGGLELIAPAPVPRGIVGMLNNLLGEDEIPTLDIFDDPVPLFGMADQAAWALLNLLLTIVGGVFALGALLRTILNKRKEQKELKEQGGEEPQKKEQPTKGEPREERFRLGSLIASLLLCIAAVVTFLLTEDMSNPMVIIDNWTLAHVIMLAVEIVAVAFAFKIFKRIVRFETAADNQFKQKVRPGDPLKMPENPTRDGYTFAGWFTDETSGVLWNFRNKVERSFTVFAKWIPIGAEASLEQAQTSSK